MSIKSLACGSLLVVLAACQPATQKTPSFDDALAVHLQAVSARDMDAFKSTLTNGDALPVIFPGGSMLMTKQEVLDFHTGWFADKDWVMEPEVLKTYVSGNLAVATTKYSYRDTADGEPRSAILGLVFELQNGEWRLVHDQNTRITESN